MKYRVQVESWFVVRGVEKDLDLQVIYEGSIYENAKNAYTSILESLEEETDEEAQVDPKVLQGFSVIDCRSFKSYHSWPEPGIEKYYVVCFLKSVDEQG